MLMFQENAISVQQKVWQFHNSIQNIHLYNFLKSRRNFSNVLYPANVAQADSRGTLKWL